MTPNGRGGYSDLHSHLVPGVDDGSRTLDEAREGVRRLREAGVRRIATTPHLKGSLTRDKGMLRTRLDEIDRAWETLQGMAAVEFPDTELHRGHEVMLDIPDPDLSDSRLRLANTSFILVEWPGLQVPPSAGLVLERLVDAGFRPIVAHPERYRGMDRDAYLAGEWKASGALLQVNNGSLIGRYGGAPRERAMVLLERGWVDLLASDFHGRPHLSPFLAEAETALSDRGGGYQFDLLARQNPSRILEGEDPVPVPPVIRNPGVWERVRKIFQPKRRR